MNTAKRNIKKKKKTRYAAISAIIELLVNC